MIRVEIKLAAHEAFAVERPDSSGVVDCGMLPQSQFQVLPVNEQGHITFASVPRCGGPPAR